MFSLSHCLKLAICGSFYTCCFTLWLLHRYNNKSWLREGPRFYDVIRSNADSYSMYLFIFFADLKDNLQESAPVPVEQQGSYIFHVPSLSISLFLNIS